MRKSEKGKEEKIEKATEGKTRAKGEDRKWKRRAKKGCERKGGRGIITHIGGMITGSL